MERKLLFLHSSVAVLCINILHSDVRFICQGWLPLIKWLINSHIYMTIGQEKQLPKSEKPHLEKDWNFKQLREFTWTKLFYSLVVVHWYSLFICRRISDFIHFSFLPTPHHIRLNSCSRQIPLSLCASASYVKTLNNHVELLKGMRYLCYKVGGLLFPSGGWAGQLCVCECARRFHAPTTESKWKTLRNNGSSKKKSERQTYKRATE